MSSAMANNSGVQQQPTAQQQQQQYQTNSSPHHCKECGHYFNSAKSLDVHLQYHKENLLKHWAIQASTTTTATHSQQEETNNNNTNHKANTIKREFIPNNTIAAAADSSDSMHNNKKSPEYSRATPDHLFGHPPTPQSYQSASSPYQSHDNSTVQSTTAFSPNFQNFQQIKTEPRSTSSPPHYQNYNSNYNEQQQQQFFQIDNQQQPQTQQYAQEYTMHSKSNAYNRYHPYQQQSYERQQQVTSSSPAYPPQPTPSPSPKQCDKCGYVCDTVTQLNEHQTIAHPPTNYQTNQHFMFGNDVQQHPIKTEEQDAQSEILDLDSHKVHQVYPEDENSKRSDHNPHSVSALLNTWTPQQQQQNPKLFQEQQQQHRMYAEQTMFHEQKLFQPHPEFMGNGVTTTTQENSINGMNIAPVPQTYRPFEHLPSQPTTPVISSTQVPNNSSQQQQPQQQQQQQSVSPAPKSTNWKSNEARRPKTYNCTACNKWFTSSGHLKRHYNTTLHKNAVKSSGQPDPATLPISAHHHPARESTSNKDDAGNSPNEESRGCDDVSGQFDRLNAMSGLLQQQQPPPQSYDRQPGPPNLHHTSPMQQNPSPIVNNLPNLNNGSPPNGEAGPSITTNSNSLDSRGLLSLNQPPPPPPPPPSHPGFNMAPPPPSMMHTMESAQFQMYPNGSAPHVMQAMAISNLNITGEFQFIDCNQQTTSPTTSPTPQQQPLPSFAQFQAHRYGLLLSYGNGDNANVGGGGSVTAPYTSYYHTTDPYEVPSDGRPIIYRPEDDDYKLTVLTVADPAPTTTTNNNNNHHHQDDYTLTPESPKLMMDDIKLRLESQPASPEKAHTKRDYEESTGSPLITSTVVVSKPGGLHKCFDCDKIFNKACYLTQHNKTFHSGDKPFKCTRCGKRFSCEITYQGHATKHAGEKPHKCDLCPKQFNHKTDLRRHMCLHTGQKPYACDTCGKGFIRKDHMLKHCETHIRKTNAKNNNNNNNGTIR